MDLIARARGDEKHDASSYSTLEAIDVLYDVMRFDPASRSGRAATGSSSRRATGRSRSTPYSIKHGFFPAEEMERFLTWDGILGGHPDRNRVPGVEASTGSLGHGLPMAVGVAYALRARGADEQRVFVLTGDAELNEGSNWEAILHAGSVRLSEPDADRRRQPVEHGGDGRHRRQARGVRLGRGDRRRARPRRVARGVRASRRRADRDRGGGRVTTMREQAMATAVDLFERDERVAIVMADISLDYLRPAVEHDPRRAVNAGIMEQSAVGIAAGFALEGFHPIVHTLAPFLTERPLEQIKLDFGYQGLGGTFISAGAAYDYGESGGTHHAAGDIQALGSIPRVEVLVPGIGGRDRCAASRELRERPADVPAHERRSRTASRSSSRPAA